ncbi:hypothetical protein [Kibdelosporangium aridum]|uniref:hypothetical protein n=1 Tax=Kibdelosporangium aridum TaxID=2030 RepID=UPI0035F0E580
MHDINTAPIDLSEQPEDNELTRLTKKTVPNGTVFTRTVFTRQQLENARRS